MDNQDFFRIRIKSLIADKATTFDLYLQINQKYITYLRAGDKLTGKKIDDLSQYDSDVFFIPTAQKDAYKMYIRHHLDEDTLEPQQKALVLRESSFTLIEELYENPDVSTALEGSKEIIHDFVELMDAEPEAMTHLIGLSAHDFYTYNHSLDVSIYSLGLGAAAGLQPAELEELGQGALFHDIGKRYVKVDIICKRGPLDEIEWAQMRRHPQFGLKLLSKFNVSDAIKAACYEHHESFEGNGYPQALRGPDIHPHARIVAIADTYDAMTTERTYNKPMRPVKALTIMRDKLAKRYDPELLKAMYSVLFELEKMEQKGA